MCRPHRFFLCGVVLLAGCASAPRTSSPLFHPPYVASRDGGFEYRLPVGWFDASADSQATGHAALLIRNDYGATIAVDEVSLDAAARRQIRQGDVQAVAELLVSLTAWDHGMVLAEPPRVRSMNGLPVARYTMVSTKTQDTLQVSVVHTGSRVYAVSALLSGERGSAGTSFAEVERGFVGSLRW
jgi:hypothetical protein